MYIFTGRESKTYVFRLVDFEGVENEGIVRNKPDIKDHKLEKTKGMTLTNLNIIISPDECGDILGLRIYWVWAYCMSSENTLLNTKTIAENLIILCRFSGNLVRLVMLS